VISDAPADTSVQTFIIDTETADFSIDGGTVMVTNITFPANMITTPAHYVIVDMTPRLRDGQVSVENLYRFFAGEAILGASFDIDTSNDNWGFSVGDISQAKVRFYNSANGCFSTPQTIRKDWAAA